MSDDGKGGDNIRGVIRGNSGQAAIGKNINQRQTTGTTQPEVTEAELAQLRQLLTDLQTQIKTVAPPDKQGPALERVAELDAAVTAKEPDLSTMEYVRNWFVKNIPALAGTVTSVVVNPIVGKLVEAAGETLAADFRRRFEQT